MNWKKTVIKTIEYVFYGIAAVQIVLGLIWACCQFPYMQNWQETYEYLDISKTWVMDEYVSFLYPMLLRVCTGIESIAGVPFYMPVYVIQLAVAVLVNWYFVRSVLKLGRGRAVWAVGYLISFPMLLQFHMSVRVESLCVSGVLLLITVLNNLKKERTVVGKVVGIRDAVCVLVTTVLLIWLLPDMVVICSGLWFIYLLGIVINIHKKNVTGNGLQAFAIQCIAFVLSLILGLSVNALVQTPGSRGRIQKTFWSAAFQRVVTDYFSRSHAMWPDEVKATFTVEEAMEEAKRSDNIIFSVGPILEADWGKERANQMYRQMALDCLRVRTKTVVYQIRDDLLDSFFMPFSIWRQDDGERMSQTGWNYGRFRESASEIVRVFWEYSIIGLLGVLILGMIKIICCRERVRSFFYILGAAMIQCFWSVFGSGQRVSYANALFVILFWCILSVVLCCAKTEISELQRVERL